MIVFIDVYNTITYIKIQKYCNKLQRLLKL